MNPDFNATTLANHLDTLGLSLPDAVANVVAVRHAALTAATTVPTVDLAAELAAGKLTAKNAAEKVTAAATALVVRDRARDVLTDLERPLAIHAARATAAAGDEIVASLRGPFDTAAADLARVTADLGPEPDERAVFAAGVTSTELWHTRRDALAVLANVRRARLTLAQTGYGSKVEDATWWVGDLANPDAAQRANLAFRGGTRFANLAAAGYRLHLNTADEVAAINTGVSLVAQAAADAAKAEKDARIAAAKAELERQRQEAEAQSVAMRERVGITR